MGGTVVLAALAVLVAGSCTVNASQEEDPADRLLERTRRKAWPLELDVRRGLEAATLGKSGSVVKPSAVAQAPLASGLAPIVAGSARAVPSSVHAGWSPRFGPPGLRAPHGSQGEVRYGRAPRQIAAAARNRKKEANPEEPIDEVPIQGGGRIQKATKNQRTPLFAEQVMDKVADLVTSSIFEPEIKEGIVKSKDIQQYVYKKLTDRFSPYVANAPEESALFLAYDEQNALVGCISIAVVPVELPGQRAEYRPLLEFLSVLPSARGKKIGKALVERVEAQVMDWGYGEVLLQVAAVNTVAIKLYEKLGYTVLAEDNTIKRPGKGDFLGGLLGGLAVSWVPSAHACMRKELAFEEAT